MTKVSAPVAQVVDDEELSLLLRASWARCRLRRGGLASRRRDKDLVAFALFDSSEVFPGYSWKELRSARREARTHGVLCQTAVEVQSALGCPFDCTYCPYSAFICLRVDVERFVDRVTALAQDRRSQTLFKFNNRTDSLALEPEYGLVPVLVERFSKLPGKYLLLYSKGDEVGDLLGLDHREKTVASFTLTPAPVAEVLEAGAPSPGRRLAAIAALAKAGYPIRVRLSPIVPWKGYRKIYAELLSDLSRVAQPELITMWTLSMVELGELQGIVPAEQLDQDCLAAAQRSAPGIKGAKGAPFPPDTRVTIYRALAELVRSLLPQARLSLCLETPEVWEALRPWVVPGCGSDLVCNCGPRTTPAAVQGVPWNQLPR